jgi:cyclohexa-1,5-dienecarbonyl-CoA hydratase
MLHELGRILHDRLTQSDVIVLRGAGERAFSAGLEVREHFPDRAPEMLSAFHGIFRQLWRADCLTVAVVQGHCLGGGCELATFCDFVLAGESAQFGQPEIKLGCFPPLALVTFPALIGVRHALDLILTGRKVGAREAQAIGLITRVVPDAELDTALRETLAGLSSLSPAVLRLARRGLWQRMGLDFENSLHEAEELYLQELMSTADAVEGLRAFLEKRAPQWSGR